MAPIANVKRLGLRQFPQEPFPRALALKGNHSAHSWIIEAAHICYLLIHAIGGEELVDGRNNILLILLLFPPLGDDL